MSGSQGGQQGGIKSGSNYGVRPGPGQQGGGTLGPPGVVQNLPPSPYQTDPFQQFKPPMPPQFQPQLQGPMGSPGVDPSAATGLTPSNEPQTWSERPEYRGFGPSPAPAFGGVDSSMQAPSGVGMPAPPTPLNGMVNANAGLLGQQQPDYLTMLRQRQRPGVDPQQPGMSYDQGGHNRY